MNTKNIKNNPSLILNIKLAYFKTKNIPNLPPLISNLYSHIFIRVFRVIGGISFILVASGYFLYFHESLHLLITIIASIQVTLVLIVTIIRIIYSMYRLFYCPNDFEIRNSTLNV